MTIAIERTITDESIEWEMTHADGSSEIIFEDDRALALLLINDIVFLNSPWWKKDLPEPARKLVNAYVICNDIFAWGCADAEELPMEEIENLYKMWQKDPIFGPAMWCILKRKQMPQPPVKADMDKMGIWKFDEIEGLAPFIES